MPSFDVVSKVTMHEVGNAVDQVQREIATRYDFRGAKVAIELNDNLIVLTASDDTRLKAMQQILREKLAKRNVSLKSIEFEETKKAGGDTLRQEVKVKEGLTTEELKRLTKLVKEGKFKVTAQIQEDQLRVSGKKRDDLQEVIHHLKTNVSDLELQFINFRD